PFCSFLPYSTDSNIIVSARTHRNPANKGVPCHLKNSKTLKLSTTSGAKPSRNRSESSALKNSGNLAKRCLMSLIDRGGKRSFHLSRNIRAPFFTTRPQAEASFSFTLATETKAYGICRGAA